MHVPAVPQRVRWMAAGMGSSSPPNFNDPVALPGTVGHKGLWRRSRDAFRQGALEFCLFTGLHGYKYIVQPGKHRAER